MTADPSLAIERLAIARCFDLAYARGLEIERQERVASRPVFLSFLSDEPVPGLSIVECGQAAQQ